MSGSFQRFSIHCLPDVGGWGDFYVFASLLLSVGCVGPPVLTPAKHRDPERLEHFVVALSARGPTMVVLETGPNHGGPELAAYDLGASRRVALLHEDSDLSALMSAASANRDMLAERVAASATGAWLEQLGYSIVQRATEPVRTPSGYIESRGPTLVVADDDEHTVTLVPAIDNAEPVAESVWVSRDGSAVALERTYAGPPLVRDAFAVGVESAEARLLAARGFAAHLEHRYAESSRLWRAAIDLDPTYNDATYNAACAEARLGNLSEALELLATAVARDSTRYRSLAQRDADLVALRDTPEFARLMER